MPIYEFECRYGHKFEMVLPLSKYDSAQFCPADGTISHKVWSLPAYPSHGAPTVIYKNPLTGDTRVAILKNQETPAGYERIELKTPFERTRAEKSMQETANAENEYVTERNRYLKEETQKNRHNDLKARMGTLTKDSDNPSAAADLLKAGMNRNRKKKLPPKKTEFHFAINHDNQSNLDKG